MKHHVTKKMILHARPQHEWNIDEHNVYKCKLMTYCTAWLYQIKSNRKISWFNELVVQHVYWASDLQSLSGVSIYVNFHVEWRVHCVGMSAGGECLNGYSWPGHTWVLSWDTARISALFSNWSFWASSSISSRSWNSIE